MGGTQTTLDQFRWGSTQDKESQGGREQQSWSEEVDEMMGSLDTRKGANEQPTQSLSQ